MDPIKTLLCRALVPRERTFVVLYWMLCAASLVAGAWLVCPAAQCFVPGLDRVGLDLAHQLRNTALDRPMAIITTFGSLWLLMPLASVGAVWLLLHKRRQECGFVLLALLGAAALAHLVKLWVARPRPDLHAIWLPMPGDWSFPSAHGMQAAALASAVFLVLIHRRAERHVLLLTALAMLLAGLVVSVGLSRIYLQVHFPSDVLAGFLAGALWVLGLHALMFPQSVEKDNASGDTA